MLSLALLLAQVLLLPNVMLVANTNKGAGYAQLSARNNKLAVVDAKPNAVSS